MSLAHCKEFTLLSSIFIAFCLSLLCAEGSREGQQGRLIHGKYFGPLNVTSPLKDIRVEEMEFGWITQPLDHFNKHDKRTWSQKFARNSTFFQPGGPVCIMISGESAMDPRWIIVGQAVSFCSKFNGVMYMLEHRFYGDSKPTKDASVESLKYLTISQALEDIARFIEFVHIKETQKVGKVVLFGGSYAGTLAAYFRQKFPQLAQVSLASSAPIQWKFDFFEYMDVVGKVLKQYGSCYNRIKSGMKVIEKIVSDAIAENYEGPINGLLGPLRLCSNLYISNKMDVLNFYASLSSVFGYYAQYNGINNNVGTIQDICEIVTTSGDNSTQSDFEVVANLIQRMHYSLDYKCIDFSNSEYCEFISATGWDHPAVAHGSRIWNWQVCSEVASFQTTTSENQPFVGVTTELFVAQCQCAFEKKFKEPFIQNAVRQHTRIFGGYQAIRQKVIYVNGENDPWSALSVVKQQQIPPFTPEGLPESVNNSQNCVILIKGASHCNDMMPDHSSDSHDLQRGRDEAFSCITKWIL